MLQKLTRAPIAAGFFFHLFVLALPLHLIFFSKKATCVCLKEPICVLCHFVPVFGHGMIMSVGVALPEALEPSGAITAVGRK